MTHRAELWNRFPSLDKQVESAKLWTHHSELCSYSDASACVVCWVCGGPGMTACFWCVSGLFKRILFRVWGVWACVLAWHMCVWAVWAKLRNQWLHSRALSSHKRLSSHIRNISSHHQGHICGEHRLSVNCSRQQRWLFRSIENLLHSQLIHTKTSTILFLWHL